VPRTTEVDAKRAVLFLIYTILSFVFLAFANVAHTRPVQILSMAVGAVQVLLWPIILVRWVCKRRPSTELE